jgi:hypothetical protein
MCCNLEIVVSIALGEGAWGEHSLTLGRRNTRALRVRKVVVSEALVYVVLGCNTFFVWAHSHSASPADVGVVNELWKGRCGKVLVRSPPLLVVHSDSLSTFEGIQRDPATTRSP